MNQRHHSLKKVKPYKQFLSEQKFFFPEILSNDMRADNKKIIKITINGKVYEVLTGEITTVAYETFCLLKDNGIITDDGRYEIGGRFDPL